mmetsp:Transcript_18387/g.51032  ORF Transcript_18387/g.51032 Transcript_18387/m.51032 type:complete len:222 (-) Transcript_18387:479-1144(-)|eukprot:CAMPEP_0198125302 /NCGR_PEP_ID=MMETSP1442-20131203/42300_1 /TAXON_ID= /ORGANISM="Craspedostauros australis, Strain CCMP3328" /LENGTH=221 /DNA_ID=CAMNT_0043784879 /DNA_START=144 /DNA_END=809 /DNA_ORIENTATION=+
MSSWERARFIPWSHIPSDHNVADGKDLTNTKERIFRQLQREGQDEHQAALEQRHDQAAVLVGGDAGAAADSATTGSSSSGITNSAILSSRVPFQWMDLFKSAAFGGCIGSITGSVFGFMDGMRGVGESSVLKNASNMAKARYLMQGTSRSATIFGTFFGGFHVVKYGARVTIDPGEFGEIAIASVASMSGLLYKPAFRQAVPYATMLILMDSVHLVMKHFE